MQRCKQYGATEDTENEKEKEEGEVKEQGAWRPHYLLANGRGFHYDHPWPTQ